jgi:hypothetical protein
MSNAWRASTIMLTTMLGVRAAVAAVPLNDSREDAGELGDTLQYVAPAVAFALTWVLNAADPSTGARSSGDADRLQRSGSLPRHELALAFGRSIVVTEALKYTFNETRPNGEGHSFPSGHTSFAFTGAEFIRKEYGWWWGMPAYAVAGFVGYSRVRSREHYTHDVLAGALIGILANHDLRRVHTQHGTFSVEPAVTPTEGRPALGLQFSFDF